MYKGARNEEGAVLAIALILLLVITVVGLSTFQTTGLEEQMAANAQQKTISFQASEAAIEEALDDTGYLGDAYTASVSGAAWPTKASTSSGIGITVTSEAQFVEVTRNVVEAESATSISLDSNALLFYNYEVRGTATVDNTSARNVNVQGAYIKAAATGAN